MATFSGIDHSLSHHSPGHKDWSACSTKYARAAAAAW